MNNLITLRRPLRRGVVALCLIVTGAAPGIAEDAGPVSIEVSDCITLATPAERLACFESRVDEVAGTGEVARAAEVAVTPATAAPSAEAASTAEPASLDDFGLRQSRDGGFERDEMTATIASVRTVAPNRQLITLENGQVWRQMHPERYRLRPGQHARIYSTRWGASYRLTVEELRGFIQVQRVQ